MGIDLYPAILMKGDLSPDSFGGEVDDICNEINEACKVSGMWKASSARSWRRITSWILYSPLLFSILEI